jgi:tetratricopeptide (TPR) repeat protein
MNTSALEQAQYYFRLAYTCLMTGQIADAKELYQKSIETRPTAEAYTFLGWAMSMEKDYEGAMEKCKRAITLDPDFGNPYNDIGAYLIHLERYDEAIPWLELACSARRYNARHYPHFNLGRIYERQGLYSEAIEQYARAARIDPSYRRAFISWERLRAWKCSTVQAKPAVKMLGAPKDSCVWPRLIVDSLPISRN